MIRRQPGATLFPYPTLCRSCDVVVPDHAPRTKLEALDRLGARTTKLPFDEWWRVLVEHRYEPFADRPFIHPVSDQIGRHTSELQSRQYLVCRFLFETKITII